MISATFRIISDWNTTSLSSVAWCLWCFCGDWNITFWHRPLSESDGQCALNTTASSSYLPAIWVVRVPHNYTHTYWVFCCAQDGVPPPPRDHSFCWCSSAPISMQQFSQCKQPPILGKLIPQNWAAVRFPGVKVHQWGYLLALPVDIFVSGDWDNKEGSSEWSLGTVWRQAASAVWWWAMWFYCVIS